MENNKQELSKYEKLQKYNKKIRQPIQDDSFISHSRDKLLMVVLCLALSFIAFVVGLFFNFTSEPNSIWFQRSGSLIVLFTLISEYYHLSLKDDLNTVLIKFEDGEVSTMNERLLKESNLEIPRDMSFSIIFTPPIVFFVILGTFIWGYGDLLYSFFEYFFYGWTLLALLAPVLFVLAFRRAVSKIYDSY